MFTYKLKFISLIQLIVNSYACSLPLLANNLQTDLLFQSAFCQPCKSTTGEMAPKEGSNLVYSGELIWLPLSVHICLDLVLEYCPFVGACTCHSYSKLRLVVQNLIDDYVLLWSVNQFNTKDFFLIELSKWHFSKYWSMRTRQVFAQTITFCNNHCICS